MSGGDRFAVPEWPQQHANERSFWRGSSRVSSTAISSALCALLIACGGGADDPDDRADCSAAGANLVYVVDDDNTLLSFDPAKLATGEDPFEIVDRLECRADSPWPGETPPARPFSVAVDRRATVWVLYSSGEIFHVSTEDASCTATDWIEGQSGFELFTMGFVSDAPDADSETLFIGGGDSEDRGAQDLGRVDVTSLTATRLAALPSAPLGPELSGTGGAELYGYYPDNASGFVGEMDHTTGATVERYPLEPLAGQGTAFAFAHHGGKFYIFVTEAGFAGETSRVIELDPAGPTETTVVSESRYKVIGAGVSTCAPLAAD